MRALALVLLLAGCGGPSLSTNQRSEVANIAEDFADDAARPDISRLEVRLSGIESKLKLLDKYEDIEWKRLESLGKENVKDAEDIRRFMDHYNKHLKDYHGGQ